MKSIAAQFTRKYYAYHRHDGNPLPKRQETLKAGLRELVPQVCEEIRTTSDPMVRKRGVGSLPMLIRMFRDREAYRLLLEEIYLEKSPGRLKDLLHGFDYYGIPPYIPLDVFLRLGRDNHMGLRRYVYSLLGRDGRREAKAFLCARLAELNDEVELRWVASALDVCGWRIES